MFEILEVLNAIRLTDCANDICLAIHVGSTCQNLKLDCADLCEICAATTGWLEAGERDELFLGYTAARLWNRQGCRTEATGRTANGIVRVKTDCNFTAGQIGADLKLQSQCIRIVR